MQQNIAFSDALSTTARCPRRTQDKFVSVATGQVSGVGRPARGPDIGTVFTVELDHRAIFVPRGVMRLSDARAGHCPTYLVNVPTRLTHLPSVRHDEMVAIDWQFRWSRR